MRILQITLLVLISSFVVAQDGTQKEIDFKKKHPDDLSYLDIALAKNEIDYQYRLLELKNEINKFEDQKEYESRKTALFNEYKHLSKRLRPDKYIYIPDKYIYEKKYKNPESMTIEELKEGRDYLELRREKLLSGKLDLSVEFSVSRNEKIKEVEKIIEEDGSKLENDKSLSEERKKMLELKVEKAFEDYTILLEGDSKFYINIERNGIHDELKELLKWSIDKKLGNLIDRIDSVENKDK